MKYAKFSDDFLSDFRLDDNGETLVLTDKRGLTRAVKLLPYEERPLLLDIDNAPTVKIPNYGGQVVPDTLQGWRYEERPQGEWIIIKSPLSTETVVKCPFCHDEFIGNDVEHYNFCPICGADMRGKEE